MSKNDINPNILAQVEAERQFAAQTGGSSARRVKIDKINQAWLVRFLPARLGPSKLFYARIANHWLHKRPITCPRYLHPDFGGDPDFECPVCAKHEELNSNHSEEISKFGYSIRANIQWIVWCICWEFDPGRGESELQPTSEIMRPWEFHMYKGTWDELVDYYRRGTKKSIDSVLDLRLGNDFWATKTKKGIRLDKQDQKPVFDENESFDASVAKILSQIKEPKIKIPDEKQLMVFAKKCEDEAFDAAHGGGSRGDDDSERGRGGSSRGSRSRLQDEEDDDEPKDEAEEERQEEPAPQRTRTRTISSAPAPARATRPAGRSIAPAEVDEPAAEEENEEEDNVDMGPAAAPSRSADRSADAPLSRTIATAGRKLAPPPAASRNNAAPPAKSTRPAPTVEESVDEEEDNVAPEDTDLAPATDEALPEEAEVPPDEAPPVRSSLKSSLKGRIQATARR